MTDYTPEEVVSVTDDFPILVGSTAADVMQTETRLGEPVAVIDSWEFGAQWAQWSNTTSLIIVDASTWDSLSEVGRDYLVAHEKHERDGARKVLDIEATALSPSDIVDRHHNEANRRAVAELGEHAARTYSKETYERSIRNCDDGDAREQATYVLRGVEECVPDEIRTDLPTDRRSPAFGENHSND